MAVDIRRIKMCERKTQYGQQEAERRARRLARKLGRDTHTYRCPYCGAWHIAKGAKHA